MDITSYLLGKKSGGGGEVNLQTKQVTITQNGTTNITADSGYDGLNKVELTTNVQEVGPVSVSEKDVNFYDYDGARVYSYTKNQFLALSSMPENPSHDGLTAQGWNWQLQEAKDYVTEYGILDVGQTYVTDTGETRIYVEFNKDDWLDFILGINIKPNETAVVNWGDGSPNSEITGTYGYALKNFPHQYSHEGKYVIKISGANIKISGNTYSSYGSNLIYPPTSYGSVANETGYSFLKVIKKIELGSNVEELMTRAFNCCLNLETITIPNTLTTKIIPHYAFGNCDSLKILIIPREITELYNYSVSSSRKIKKIILPSTITAIGQTSFSATSNLKTIVLPEITSINNYTFSASGLLKLVVPKNVATIGTSGFNNNMYLKYLDFSHHTSVPTLSNINAFDNIVGSYNKEFKIIVPDDLYDDWIVANNWNNSDIVERIIKESDWNIQ